MTVPALLERSRADGGQDGRPRSSPDVARELRRERDVHNGRLEGDCREHQIPLVDVRSKLGDEHLADNLHPNEAGARIIAGEVFQAPTVFRRTEGPALMDAYACDR